MTVEVKTRLTIDEKQAMAGLGKTSQGYAKLAKEAQKAAGAATGFVKQAAATAAGVYLPRMVHGAYNMAKSFFDVAAASEESTKSFAGLYGMFRNIPFAEATKEAVAMKDELRTMAVEIGKKPAEAYATFQTQARAMGAETAEQMALARQQTEQLMVVADALGMEVGELSGEFAMFSKAPRIMRGPMFDILRATGVFGKDLQAMNKNWGKMNETAKKAGLAQALAAQAKKLKEVPEDWNDSMNRVTEVLRQGKEAVGKPILDAMKPAAAEFVAEMKKSMPDLKAGGEAIGKKAAEWMKKGFDAARSAFAYAKSHSRQIKEWLSSTADKVKTAFSMAMSAAKFIYAHKEIFAAMLIGPKVAGGIGAAVGGVGSAVGAVGKAAGMGGIGTGAGAIGNMLAALGSGSVIAGAGVVTAAVAAIAAVAAAGYQAVKLVQEVARGDSAHQDAQAQIEAAQKMINEGRLAEGRLMIEQARQSQKKASYGPLVVEGLDKAVKAANDLESQQNQIDSMYSHAVGNFGDTINESSERTTKLMSELVDTWNAATATNDAVMQTAAANVLMRSQASRDLLAQSGFAIAGGLSAMDKAVIAAYDQFKTDMGSRGFEFGAIGGSGAGGAGEAGARARRAQMREAMKKGAEGAGVNVNVGGGNTVTIKQDFRDQDPDRVVIAFHRDLLKAALSRRSSRMTSIFGAI